MTPSIGRVVIASVTSAENNGATEAPAIVTRVWKDHPDGGWLVNLRILCDSENIIWRTSARLYDEPPASPVLGDCWWPPRI